MAPPEKQEQKASLKHSVLTSLGPGIVAGAADDDPAGIATYTIAGAQLGHGMLWTPWLTWPMMAAVQMMCARIGMVTGKGLAGAFQGMFPRWLLILLSLAMLTANSINIGADLAGMADATRLLLGGNSHVYIVLYGVFIVLMTIFLPYRSIARVLKWLAMVLLAYVGTALMVVTDWAAVLKAAFSPSWPRGQEMWMTLLAILGTTISPYLFVWQASQEVEEEKAQGREVISTRKGATAFELRDRMVDIGIGTFFANAVMFFIILTASATLHANGITNIQSSAEAAQALRPLAGEGAVMLYTVGIIGVGMLAIPTLAGSAAYLFAETFRWRNGLDKPFHLAKSFYSVIILAMAYGVLMDFLQINPLRAMFLSAVINGAVAPFVLVGIFMVARHSRIMLGQPSSLFNQAVVVFTTLVMFGALVGMAMGVTG